MNPCGSSGEQGGGGSWGTSDNWEHPSGVICQFQGFGGNFQTPARPEWDQWDNAMLFSHNQTAASSTHHHGHIQLEHKPNIFASTPATDLRHYSSCGEFPTSTFPQNTLLNELNQTGVRHNFGNFEGMHMQNIPTTQLLPAGMGSGIPGLAATNAMSTDMRAAFDQRHRLFDIMDFEQRNIGDFFKSCEEPYSGVDVQGRIGLNLAMGGRTYFSAEDSVVARLAKRQRFNSPAHVQMPKCQAEGCTADLSRAKHYHRRHKVCELHSKAACVIANGQTQRFCQQCSRFHVLSDFDEAKRSCRKRLADHNRRRRKPQLSTISDENPTARSLTLKSEEHNIMIQSSKPTVSAADTTSMLLRHFKKTGSPSASTEELNDHRSSALIDFPLNSFSSVRKTDEKPVLKRSFLAGSHNSGTQTSDSQHRVFSAVNSLAPSTSLIDDAARNYSSIHSLQQHGHERMFQHYLQGIPASTGPNLSLSTLTGRNGLGMTARAAGLRQPPTKYYSEEDNIAAATNWRKPEGLLPDFPHESLRSRSSSLEWMSGSISCQEQRQTKRQQLGSISNYLGLNRSGDHIEGHSNILSLSETSPCKDGRNIESAVALEFQALQSDVDAEDIMGPQPLKFSDLQSLRPFGSCVYD